MQARARFFPFLITFAGCVSGDCHLRSHICGRCLLRFFPFFVFMCIKICKSPVKTQINLRISKKSSTFAQIKN